HGVMNRAVAERGERVVAGSPYRMFYNPMWGFFGDREASPPGTFYYDKSKILTYFWNIFDQVLLRPELIERLVEVQILTTDGQETLLETGGRPDKANASDHLPLLFRLNL